MAIHGNDMLGNNMLLHEGAALGAGERVGGRVVVAEDGGSALYYACKRSLDVVVAATLLIVLAPVLVAIVIAIRLDSPGSAIFVQERVGARRRARDGRTTWEIRNFPVYKFRSMVSNADQSMHQAHVKAWIDGQVEAAEDGAKFKLANDPRVTGVGRFLRKTSLDELPQLVNVVKGEMSLVGPRPVPTYEVAEYEDWHHERLAALPGITGLWQVKGRGEVSFEEMVRLDVEYVRTASLRLDLKLLALTIPAVVVGRGAK